MMTSTREKKLETRQEKKNRRLSEAGIQFLNTFNLINWLLDST